MGPRRHTHSGTGICGSSTRDSGERPDALAAGPDRCPAAVTVWSGWVGLGGMCGSTRSRGSQTAPASTPAITPGRRRGVWGVCARCVTRPRRSRGDRPGVRPPVDDRRLVFGMLGQLAYHLLVATHANRAPWPVVVLMSCLPVVTLGVARAALTHLLRVPVPAHLQHAGPDPGPGPRDGRCGRSGPHAAAARPPAPSSCSLGRQSARSRGPTLRTSEPIPVQGPPSHPQGSKHQALPLPAPAAARLDAYLASRATWPASPPSAAGSERPGRAGRCPPRGNGPLTPPLPLGEMTELMAESWQVCAPRQLLDDHDAEHPPAPRPA